MEHSDEPSEDQLGNDTIKAEHKAPLPWSRDSQVEIKHYDSITQDDEASFIRHLHNSGVHPVLIFGTGKSGKSAMLQSLLHYARTKPIAQLEVRLGRSVFPDNVPGWQQRYNDGQEFFRDGVMKFVNGELVPLTHKMAPFFIPVDLTVDGKQTIKLAFQEGMGEWYDRSEQGMAQFQEFKPEITAVLRSFTNPISVIFVAPSVADGDVNGWRKGHESLTHCMDEYHRLRSDTSRDNLLLLASKWDQRFNPGDHSGNFAAPQVDVLVDELERWGMSWATFSAMSNVGGKALMPYSAGWIDKNFIRDPGPYQVHFDRFNQTLLNWLYGNACQHIAGKTKSRKILLGDSPPLSGYRPNLLDLATNILLWKPQ